MPILKRLEYAVAHTFSNLSRSQAKQAINAGKIKVNGKLVRSSKERIPASRTTLLDLHGDVRPFRIHTSVLLFKPVHTLTSTRAEIAGRKTVYEVMKETTCFHPDLRAVGRLDYDSAGVLVFTTDGDLLQRLTHPTYKVPKLYRVVLEKPCSEEDAEALAQGVEITDKRSATAQTVTTRPARVAVDTDDRTCVEVTLQEGMNRQLRRMFHARNNEVLTLTRLSMGPVQLGEARPGEARLLTADEEAALYTACGLKVPD